MSARAEFLRNVRADHALAIAIDRHNDVRGKSAKCYSHVYASTFNERVDVAHDVANMTARNARMLTRDDYNDACRDRAYRLNDRDVTRMTIIHEDAVLLDASRLSS